MSIRISTNAIYQASTGQMNTLQSQLARTQMQLSTNRRMLTAADDPIAAARALETTQSQSMNSQYATNRSSAKTSLSLEEQSLSDATDLLEDVQTLTVQAANGTLSDSERSMVATELEARMNDLLGVANTSDGTGTYLFSGYQSTTKPFDKTPAGATYQGDQGQRMLQVGSSRRLAVSDTGAAVFENIPTGNGTFQASPGSANKGSAVINSTAVTDRSQLNGHDYTVKFGMAGIPAAATYTVTDNVTKTDVSTGKYVSGQQIAFGGMALSVEGNPADGDTVSVAPSQKQSLFSTLTNLIGAVRGPSGTEAEKAAMSNGIKAASGNLQQALDSMLTVRSSVGSRLKELDYLDSSGEDLNIQYQSTLSDLQDLDMAKTISLFTQQQQTLQAAQMSFKTMSGLSLFNYIS
jgi:flagellar hook-associated protein 3 FlgL